MSIRWYSPLMLGAALMATGCTARRPLLYPNEQLNRVGQSAADRDIEECMRLANAYVSSSGKARDVARDTGVGGGTGAAIGAVGGAIYGGAGRGAAAGAATGATAGLIHGLFSAGGASPIYRSYVNSCLADRGYRVIGWQ
jgi:outer membrane lipoprotein SlyB